MKNITLTGILVASDWDKENNIVGLSLFTDEEEEFIIENIAEIVDFENFLEKRVEVIGDVINNENGKKYIKVCFYDKAEEYDEDTWSL